MNLSARGLRQRGASLVEVLVAILIVSLGVISMAALLANATRLGKASEVRAVAGLLAADIGDRMKANRCGVTGHYWYPAQGDPGQTEHCAAADVSSYNLVEDFAVLDKLPDSAAACAVAKACTVAELADIDVAEWRQALYRALPNGTGYIQYDAGAEAGGGAVDVWVAWLDPTALSTNEYQDLDDLNGKTCPPGFQGVSPQPRCMYFRVGL